MTASALAGRTPVHTGSRLLVESLVVAVVVALVPAYGAVTQPDVLWPVLIGLVFLGVGSWMLNIVIAIVASSALGGIASELRRRRKYLPPAEEDLR